VSLRIASTYSMHPDYGYGDPDGLLGCNVDEAACAEPEPTEAEVEAMLADLHAKLRTP
jgi:hypothetical protein